MGGDQQGSVEVWELLSGEYGSLRGGQMAHEGF